MKAYAEIYPENDWRNYFMHSDESMKYGLPGKKKYPMPDRDHVMSAIKFFNYVSPSDEKELARNIVARIKEYGITDINVGERNRFGKYYRPEQYLQHHGVKGQKWGVQNGPPYPLDRKFGNRKSRKSQACNNLLKELNNDWDYGVLYKGKHVTDTANFDWSKYRTTPIETLKKEKCGVCWDFVNYQHSELKRLGIKDENYMFVMQKSNDPDDVVTHTFTTYNLDGKKYWIESAMWPKRGIHEISDYKDVIEEIKDNYKIKDADYSLFQFNPDGLDKGLSDQEYFDAATRDLVYDHKHR